MGKKGMDKKQNSKVTLRMDPFRGTIPSSTTGKARSGAARAEAGMV
jgi:hypothetical protein